MTTQSTDTVRIVEILRDTTVQVAVDSSMIRALLECDSLGQVHLKRLLDYQAGSRLKPPALSIKDNVLTATATADSMAIYLTLKDRLEQHVSTNNKSEVITIEVNRLTQWQTFWVRFGQIVGVAMIILIVMKLSTPI